MNDERSRNRGSFGEVERAGCCITGASVTDSSCWYHLSEEVVFVL